MQQAVTFGNKRHKCEVGRGLWGKFHYLANRCRRLLRRILRARCAAICAAVCLFTSPPDSTGEVGFGYLPVVPVCDDH
jgi:hypothetical protein